MRTALGTTETKKQQSSPVNSATSAKTVKPVAPVKEKKPLPSYAWDARGEHIERLQAGLEQLGYLAADDLSGAMDQATATALCKFQVREGMLVADSPRCGTVGTQTFARLEKRTGKHICPSQTQETKK